MVDVYQTQNTLCTKEKIKSLPASIMYDPEEVQARARRGIQYELMCAPMIHKRFPSDKFKVCLMCVRSFLIMGRREICGI